MRRVSKPGGTITKQVGESIALYAVVAMILAACIRASAVDAPAQRYEARGVIVQAPVGNTVVIKHDSISNYMAAMTMPFEDPDTNELRDLHAGDAVSFQIVVMPAKGWIEHLKKLNATPLPIPNDEAVHFERAEAALQVGDPLPDFHFTNELGQPVDLRQYRGQTLAFTFFFTSCPFPNFCPRMTMNFAEANALLREKSPAPPPWHLFSISFDTAKDTPAHLLEYAKARHYDPAHWSFLTGDAKTIEKFAALFDERYWNEGQSIGHNLRTAVIDPSGRIRRIINGSSWASDELAAIMTQTKTD